jgi:ADP-heptose:LPS heptosyltransferase
MRRIDRWVGVPMCWALTLLRRLDDRLLRRRSPQKPYPALVRAREQVGAQNLYFVVFEQNRFIVDLLRIVPPENVLAIRTKGALATLLNTLRVVMRMRRERIDATIDCEFFARSTAILSYLSGARTRAGFHAYHGEASYRGDLMTQRLSFNPFLHASQIFHLLVEALWKPAEQLPACDYKPPEEVPLPQFVPEPQERAEVERMLCEALGVDRVPPVILLNANCGDLLPLRRWAPQRYVELARRLLERYSGAAVVLTGAPDEAEEAEALVGEVGSERCVSFAGKTTLRQLFVLYCLSELMVTNDSGPAHYSTVTPLDVITIFGPETPAAFGARTPRSHLLWSGIACSPCVNAFNDRQSACRDNLCMQKIGVDEVFDLACSIFDRRRGSGSSAGDERPAVP